MNENNKEEKLEKDVREFFDKIVFPGIFKIYATIYPERVDQEDLKNYARLAPSVTSDMMPVPTSHIEQFYSSDRVDQIKNSDIYNPSALPAVLDDLKKEKPKEMVSNDVKLPEEQVMQTTNEEITPAETTVMSAPLEEVSLVEDKVIDTSPKKLVREMETPTPTSNFIGARSARPGDTLY